MSISFLKGDCLDIMATMPDKSIDCFICDLPYGCLSSSAKTERKRYIGGKDTGTVLTSRISGCAWDIPIDLSAFWKQIKRLRRSDNVPTIMFCTTRFGYDLIKSNENEFRYDLVWSKPNAVGFLSANKKPMTSHEMIYIFSKKGSYYDRIDITGDFPKAIGGASSATFLPIAGMPNTTADNTGKRCVKTVIDVSNKKIRGGHPTQKPYDLYEWLLSRYCPDGGTVLDPTAGSFTSCRVAKDLGYKAIGIEKDPKFFYKAVGAVE